MGSILSGYDVLSNELDTNIQRRKELEFRLSTLLFKGFVNMVVVGDKISLKNDIANEIDRAISENLKKHQNRTVYSIDCRGLRKGDARGWLKAISDSGEKDPILIIEHITEIPTGDNTIYDDAQYVENILGHAWKNKEMFIGDIHIDSSQFTVILTSTKEHQDDLSLFRADSFAWKGEYEFNIKMDRPRKIAFISCSATKMVLQENEVAPAKDLYTSTLFRLAWRYAEEIIKADRIYILSAKHHLLHPETMIGTYNETLKKKKAAELKSWSKIVSDQMEDEGFDFYNDQFYVLAGKPYYKYLVTNSRFKHITYPYANCKGIGFILQFLKNSLNQ